MKKKLPVIIGIILTILIAVFYGDTNKTHKIYDNNVNTAVYQAIGVLQEGETVTQTFTSQEDVLNGFMIKSDVLGDYGNVEVTLRLFDAETGEQVSQGTEKGSSVAARSLHYYKIEPVMDCKGRAFILEVSETGTSENNGINLFFQPDAEKAQGLTVKGNTTTGVFVMKTVTERFDIETFCVMLFSEWFIWGFLWFLYRLFK
jgi:hypothetical protein